MSDRAITAHALLPPAEAQAILLTWFDALGLELAYAEGDLLIAWVDDTLVVETRIHPLPEGVQVRWQIRHGDGPEDAQLAAETARSLALCLARDGRWVVDGRDGPRP
jgi:hypothetical protein